MENKTKHSKTTTTTKKKQRKKRERKKERRQKINLGTAKDNTLENERKNLGEIREPKKMVE